MSAQHKGSAKKTPRHQVAAHWLLEMQFGEFSAQKLRRWQKWTSAQNNRQAFDEMEDLWRKMDDMPRPTMPTDAECKADTYDGRSSVTAHLTGETVVGTGKGGSFTRYALSLAAAITAVGLGIFFFAQWPKDKQAPIAVYETAVAQHQEVTLNDGSQIQLGARTAVTTNVTKYTRTVVLDRGEALFHVAHDPSRPFRVMAGSATITAVGTAFNVRRLDDGQVVVTVTEGTVELAANKVSSVRGSEVKAGESARVERVEDALATQRVTRGQEISYDREGRFSTVRQSEAGMSVTWREGRLQYRGEPLSHIVPDINRYSRRSIVLGDLAAGQLLYSGTVFERDVDDWIAGLEQLFPELQVIELDQEHVLIRMRLPAER